MNCENVFPTGTGAVRIKYSLRFPSAFKITKFSGVEGVSYEDERKRQVSGYVGRGRGGAKW